MIEHLSTLVMFLSFGILFLLLEIFVLPGFGVAGITGVIFIVGSIVASFFYAKAINYAIYFTLFTAVFTIVIIYFSFKILKHTKLGKGIVLDKEFSAEDGYVSVDQTLSRYVGKTGKAISKLKPQGKVVIEGITLQAISEQGFIEANEDIVVTNYDSNVIFVIKKV